MSFGVAAANRPAHVEAGPSTSVASTSPHSRDTPTSPGARGQTHGKDRPQEGGTCMRMSSVRALGLSRCGGHRGSTMTNASPSRSGRQGLGVVAWRRAPPRASGSRAGGANRNAQPRVPGRVDLSGRRKSSAFASMPGTERLDESLTSPTSANPARRTYKDRHRSEALGQCAATASVVCGL